MRAGDSTGGRGGKAGRRDDCWLRAKRVAQQMGGQGARTTGDAEHKDTFHLLPSASQAGESENNKEKRAKSCHASRLLC